MSGRICRLPSLDWVCPPACSKDGRSWFLMWAYDCAPDLQLETVGEPRVVLCLLDTGATVSVTDRTFVERQLGWDLRGVVPSETTYRLARGKVSVLASHHHVRLRIPYRGRSPWAAQDATLSVDLEVEVWHESPRSRGYLLLGMDFLRSARWAAMTWHDAEVSALRHVAFYPTSVLQGHQDDAVGAPPSFHLTRGQLISWSHS